MTAITRQHQRLERALQREASPVPTPRSRPAWLLLGAGVAVGLLLGGVHRWLISPVNPAPEAVTAERCQQLFKLPNPTDLEPRLTAQQWAEFQRHLGPQRLQPPAPASPPPATEPSC